MAEQPMTREEQSAYVEALRRIEECREAGKQGTSLDLRRLGLTKLTARIGDLKSLTKLNISDNQLTGLPAEIGELKSLTELSLHRNQLTGLPAEIGKLKSLTMLDLRSNQLTGLPGKIGELKSLTVLDLSGNQLTGLPAEIGKLKSLTRLGLSGNQLTGLPAEIGKLKSLTQLGLSGNQLTGLPAEIGELKSLTELYLHRNQLTGLPAEIGKLKSLTGLDLSGNRLTVLPTVIGALTALRELFVTDNPMPAEILRVGEIRGGERLIRFLQVLWRNRLKARGAAKPRRFDEAKVLFVGPGEVGKTWLLKALQGEVPRVKGSTKGMEIAREPMEVAHPTEAGRTLRLNCWDFGGQEHYQITHQIFFSSKAVYLLIWKPRTGVDPDLVPRLERIELSAGRSAKVLIVSTHADGNVPAVIGKEALKERFGDLIWGFYETDSKAGPKGTGVQALREEIAKAVAQLDGMEFECLPHWHEAQQAIRATRKQTIRFCDFVAICKDHGMDAASAADLAAIMEVQGHTVFFSDATNDGQAGVTADQNLVVLDPEWLAKAVGFVIEDKETRQASGILQHDRLKTIWRKDVRRHCPGYRKELHGFLLWMMWRFDIAYRQSEATSLLPELISRNRPDDLRWTPATPAGQDREATLICRIPHDPPVGLIPALTAAVHPLRRVQHLEGDRLDRNWREGFFLDTARRGTAFVELQDRDLRIVVRDEYPANLVANIERTLCEIVKMRWPQLQMDERVPCITRTQGKGCKGTFRKSRLEEHRGRMIYCEECGRDVEPEMMLEGFNAREAEVRERLEAIQLGQRKLRDGQQELLEQQRALMASSFAFFQQALDPARAELSRAPSMFTIIPDEAKPWQVLSKLTQQRVRVTCWCEHPDGPHPGATIGSGEPPDYVLTMPKDWVVKAAPYISWAATLLKAFVPMAGNVVQQGLGDLVTPDYKDAITLMNDATKALPTGKLEPGRVDELDPMHRHRPEIVALRHIHDALLAHVSEAKRWGDLRPVNTRPHGLLWLCEKHAAIQQPPLQQLD